MRQLTGKRKWRALALVWAATLFFIWPILRHHAILQPRESRTVAAIVVSYLIAALICFGFYRAEFRRLGRSRAAILILLIFLLTCVVNQIHHYYIDKGALFGDKTNLDWQEAVHIAAVQFNPAGIPHIYRFLPDGIVLWMQICRIRFDTARDIYRLIFGLLLFYSLYRFARRYTDYLGSVLTLFLVALVYPISFEFYAGQLADPLSHLSFVLAFIFLETGEFAFLFSTLMIGSLAKETVLALAGFYVLFCRSQKHYRLKALTLCLASLAIYYGVRLLVLRGTMHYGQISAVNYDHAWDNLRSSGWPIAILTVLGGYAVFLIVGWRETPPPLKRLALYITPVLLVSNLFFGWLYEARNYMAAAFVLAVITARYISRRVVAKESSASGTFGSCDRG